VVQTRRLSNEHEGIADQTITGDGSAVIAATSTGRLLSIDTSTGAVTQLLGSPGPPALFIGAVPGSYNEVVGSYSTATPELLIANIPAILLGPSPRGVAFQIPWELQSLMQGILPPLEDFVAQDIVFRGSEPAWEKQLVGRVQGFAGVVLPVGPTGPDPPYPVLNAYVGPLNYAIHQDWSGPVNLGSPAHPGEIIHFYGSGWGQVDEVVPTGKPTPSDRLYRMTAACEWRATGMLKNPDVDASVSVEAIFTGLAPGLVGVYQLDFRIPPDWTESTFDAYCKLASGSNTFYAGTAAVEVQP
jgi:hypothetical protein